MGFCVTPTPLGEKSEAGISCQLCRVFTRWYCFSSPSNLFILVVYLLRLLGVRRRVHFEIAQHKVVDQPRLAEHDGTAQEGTLALLDRPVEISQLFRIVQGDVQQLDVDPLTSVDNPSFHLVHVLLRSFDHASHVDRARPDRPLRVPFLLRFEQGIDENGAPFEFVGREVRVPAREGEVGFRIAERRHDDEVVRKGMGHVQVEAESAEQESLLDVFLSKVRSSRLRATMRGRKKKDI